MKTRSQVKRVSPLQCGSIGVEPNGSGCAKVLSEKLVESPKSSRKRLFDQISEKTKWNPRDPAQMKAVKEALHVATTPENVVCREAEQEKILDFCKTCIQQEKAGRLYVCGCPGTGKTLSIEKVKGHLATWSKEVECEIPEMLSINCTSLTNPSEIFKKVLEKLSLQLVIDGTCSPLQHLQKLFSRTSSSSRKMMMIIVDEMDYLLTKDHMVLHDLFMLTTLPGFRCLLIGIANVIDLPNRFLPRLESLNCKPTVVTFHAYSKDQILEIIKQRLTVLGYEDVFEPTALEFCARKVAAASGDMRSVLGICRSAIEVLEEELRVSSAKQASDIVNFEHMDVALSKAFKPSVINRIKSLPQHQQIILCSVLKFFNQFKKNATTLGELNKSYSEVCKANHIPAVGMLEFTNLCKALSDQGLLKLGTSKEVRQRRVTMQIDGSDVGFALKNIRFFHNCLEDQ